MFIFVTRAREKGAHFELNMSSLGAGGENAAGVPRFGIE